MTLNVIIIIVFIILRYVMHIQVSMEFDVDDQWVKHSNSYKNYYFSFFGFC